MRKIRWHGVFPAVTTKLKRDCSLDLDAIGEGLERLIDAGVGGVVMLGMVGENAQLLPSEKLSVLRTAKEAVAGRVPIVAKLVQHIKLAEHLISGSAETVKPPRLPLAGVERERSIAIVQQTLADLQALGA